MKRYMMILIMFCIAFASTKAMSYKEARREALYLTDKMAYELNLNAEQYEYAYEINLDYLLSLDRPSDVIGIYYRHRCADLRDILHDWQYRLFLAADYFLRPVVWEHTHWCFPIYHYYVRDHFFYSCPHVYHSYRGGHHTRHHHHSGFYCGRRPQWTQGFRGVHRDKIHHAHRRPNTYYGDGYHFKLPQNARPSYRDDDDDDDDDRRRPNYRPSYRGERDDDNNYRRPIKVDRDDDDDDRRPNYRPSYRGERDDDNSYRRPIKVERDDDDDDDRRPLHKRDYREYNQRRPSINIDRNNHRSHPAIREERSIDSRYNKFVRLDNDKKQPIARPATTRPTPSVRNGRSSFRNSSTRTTVQQKSATPSRRPSSVNRMESRERKASISTRNVGNERRQNESRRGR